MTLIDIKSATITQKGQIAIPRNIRKKFKTGSRVAILAYDDRIELRPFKQVSESIETAVASEKILSKDWDSKEEDEAWRNL